MQNQDKPKQKETEIKQDQTQKTSQKDSQKKQNKQKQNDDFDRRFYTLMQVGKNGLNFEEVFSQDLNGAKHIVRDVLKLE